MCQRDPSLRVVGCQQYWMETTNRLAVVLCGVHYIMEMSTELDELEVFYAPESSFHEESKPEPEIVREGHPSLWEQ